MKNTKRRTQYVLIAVLALLVGVGGGLALGQRGDDEPSREATDSAGEEEGKPVLPMIQDERTLYAGEPNVAPQRVVRAGRFELSDEKGNIRAVLGLNPDGEPRLAFADDSGQILATVGLELDYKFIKNKIATLRLLDRGGKVRTEISLNRSGDPTVVLRNLRGGTVASLTATDKSGTEWMLMDENGRPRIIQNVNQNGTTISLMDGAGKTRAGLGIKPDGNPSLMFSDEKMKNRLMLGYMDDVITDKKSKESKAVSSLALFDKDGKVLWKAP